MLSILLLASRTPFLASRTPLLASSTPLLASRTIAVHHVQHYS